VCYEIEKLFDSWQGQEIFLFKHIKLVVGPMEPSIQWVQGGPFSGVEWFGHEADLSPPSGAEVKMSRGRAPFSHMPSWCEQEQLYLYLVQ